MAIVGLTGATAIDTKDATVTGRFAEPLIAPDVAVIVLVPTDIPVAKPDAVIVATVVALEVQFTKEVTSFFVPSE